MLDGDPGYKAGGWRRGQWYGVRGLWKYLETKKYKMHVRVLLARYRGYDECPDCHGTRLRKEALAVRLGGKTIAELEAAPVGELPAFLDGLTLGKQARATAAPILRELTSRLYVSRRGRARLPVAHPPGAHALGRRGAAHRARRRRSAPT